MYSQSCFGIPNLSSNVCSSPSSSPVKLAPLVLPHRCHAGERHTHTHTHTHTLFIKCFVHCFCSFCDMDLTQFWSEKLKDLKQMIWGLWMGIYKISYSFVRFILVCAHNGWNSTITAAPILSCLMYVTTKHRVSRIPNLYACFRCLVSMVISYVSLQRSGSIVQQSNGFLCLPIAIFLILY